MKRRDNQLSRMNSLARARKPRERKIHWLALFLKLLLWGILIVACYGLYRFSAKVYHSVSSSQIVDWHVKDVSVNGVTGQLAKSLLSLTDDYKGKPFSTEESIKLRQSIEKKYPMLKDISVKRDLLDGILKISAEHRTPIAKFVVADKKTMYIDADSTIYSDDNPNLLKPVPYVELIGNIPSHLSQELIDLLESSLKLNRELDFAFLTMNLRDNTVDMHMPDGSIIDFGPATQLKQKARRASQIIVYAKEHEFSRPYKLNFNFFEYGKVFLTKLPN